MATNRARSRQQSPPAQQATYDEAPMEDDDQDSDSDDSDNGNDPATGAKWEDDGKGGSSCHQCKSRRNHVALTYCTSTLDKKNKRCRKKFCGHCLKKFYKESPSQIVNKNTWICPSCRGICCCAACRRRKTRGGAALAFPSASAIAAANARHQQRMQQKKMKTQHQQQRRAAAAAAHDTTSAASSANNTHMHNSSALNQQYNGHHRTSGLAALAASPAINSMTSPHFSSLDGSAAGMLSSPLPSSFADYDLSQDVGQAFNPADYEDDSAYSSDGDGDMSDPDIQLGVGAVPATQFYNMLSKHIHGLAQDAKKDTNSPFAKLYRSAQTPQIKRKIAQILTREDLKREKKVDMIANLLLPLQAT